MLDVESKLALVNDVPVVSAFVADHGGYVDGDETDDAIFWLTLVPRSDAQQAYFSRIRWTKYPYAPASVLFATAIRGELGVLSSWPLIPGYRAPNDICRSFTQEGYTNHPEWANGPTAWSHSGNPFLRTVSHLQNDLDNNYTGRAS